MKYGNSIDRANQSNIVEKKRDPKYLAQNAYTYHIHRISELPDCSVVFDWKE